MLWSHHKFARLQNVLSDELGHDLAFAVERGKIETNSSDTAHIRMGMIETGLDATLSMQAIDASLSKDLHGIRIAATEALEHADIRADQVTRLVMVGGSSLMTTLRREMQQLCPNAAIETENAMTAVADGLAISAEQSFA